MGGKGTGVTNGRERLSRINGLWQMIIDNPSLSREEVIGRFCYNYGLSRRKAMEYLKILINAGKIKNGNN